MGNLKLIFIAIFISNAIIVFGQNKETTTIILVRHAEKDSVGNDPDLSEKGRESAWRIAHLLKHEDIAAVFSTPFNRTRQTAKAIAEIQGVDINEYNPFQTELLDQWVDEYRGKTIVLVGHSNTVPIYINLLLGEELYKSLSDDEYDKMFIVTLPLEGKPNVFVVNTAAVESPTN